MAHALIFLLGRKKSLFNQDCVYEMLSPSDEEMISEAEKMMTGAKEFVRKMNIVSTKDAEDKDDCNAEDKQAKVSCLGFLLNDFS